MSKSSFNDIINSATPVLLDFHADWCGPCKAQAPILQQLKSQMGNKVKIVKIDVDRNQPLANKLGIRSIPTLALFRHGSELARQAGAMASGDIVRWARGHLGG